MHSTVTADSWLTESVRLANASAQAGGGPFGAVVVRDDRILATATNRVTADLDPTAHAEVMAIRAACRELGDFRLAGATLISSCEPCPLCLAAALWSRVDEVVYAADRHDAAAGGFDDRAFYELFERPRHEWDMPIRQVSIPDCTIPFSTWLSNSERVEY